MSSDLIIQVNTPYQFFTLAHSLEGQAESAGWIAGVLTVSMAFVKSQSVSQ